MIFDSLLTPNVLLFKIFYSLPQINILLGISDTPTKKDII